MREKKVLVVCNTVEQAQNVYKSLYIQESKLLLHGSFNAEDRNKKEVKLQNEEVTAISRNSGNRSQSGY